MRECMKELQNLIRAKVRCVWINSYEEEAVIDDIKEVASNADIIRTNMTVYSHSFSSGTLREKIFLNPNEEKVMESPDNNMNTGNLFNSAYEITRNIEHKYLLGEKENILQNNGIIIEDKNNIFILKDFHLLLSNAQYVRMLRDVVEGEWINYNLFVIVAPCTEIPNELEKLFYIIDYDTPNEEYITNFFDGMISNLKRKKGNNFEEIDDNTKNKIISACKGLTFKEIEYIFKLSLLKYKTISFEEINNFKIELIKKSNVLDYKIPSITLEDIGGNQAFKNWIDEVIDGFTPEALEFGCMKPKGYLALGIPGSAKTAMAEAIAGTMGKPLLKLNMAKILEGIVGATERNMAKAIRMVKSMAPCVLLIDECEKSLSGLGSSNVSDAGTMSRVIGSILEFLMEDHGVFVIMTSNNISNLPPELTRTGRLDAIWYFGIPTEEERKEIFNIHFNKCGKPLNDEILNYAAKSSDNFTGAEIQEAVKRTMIKAFNRYKKDNNKDILRNDIKVSCSEIIPIAVSSEEDVKALERFARNRARYANKPIENKCVTEKNKESKSVILSLKDIK